jgi:hypothetical protein
MPALELADQLACSRALPRATDSRHLALGAAVDGRAAAAAAGGERTRQLVDLGVLLGVDRACLLQRRPLAPCAGRQLGNLAVPVEQQALGLVEPCLHARQAVGDRLLEHSSGILVLFQVGLQLHNVGLGVSAGVDS